MGIINPDCIDSRWLEPIDEKLVVSPEVFGFQPPESIDQLTDLVVSLRHRLDCGAPPQPPHESAVPRGFGEIPVRYGFARHQQVFWEHADLFAGPPLSAMKASRLPGTIATWPHADFEDDVLLVEYTVRVENHRRVRVFVNTPQNVRVWIDSQYRFGREGGRMAPSAHYVPINQFVDMDWSVGDHRVVAAIEKPAGGSATWVFGVADARTRLWLGDAIWFDRSGVPSES